MRRLRLFMLLGSYWIITVQKHRQKTYGLFRKLTKEMRGVFCQAHPTISRSQRQTPQWKPHVMLVYKLLELFKLNGPKWYGPKPTEFNAQILVQLVLFWKSRTITSNLYIKLCQNVCFVFTAYERSTAIWIHSCVYIHSFT